MAILKQRQLEIRDDICRDFSAELMLLLTCGNQQPNAAEKYRIRQSVSGEIDWSSFLWLTKRHCVVPHAYLALRRAASDLVPQQTMDALALCFERNHLKNLAAGGELVRMCRAANAAGLPLMCFKGPALALQVYEGLQCRQFKDLDLLVPRDRIVEAVELLRQLGYHEQSQPLATLRPRQLRRLLRYHKHVTLTNPDKPGITVELHWELSDFGEFDISHECLWNESHKFSLGRADFHALPEEEQIAFLAWHGGMHRWKRLRWLFDLAQAIRTAPQYSESRLLETASTLGVENYMVLGLSLVATLTNAGRPNTSNQPPHVRRLMRLSSKAMLADEMYYESRPLSAQLWAWRLSQSRRFARVAWLLTFAPRIEHMHLSGPIAYLKRIERLEWRMRELLASGLEKFVSR